MKFTLQEQREFSFRETLEAINESYDDATKKSFITADDLLTWLNSTEEDEEQ